VDENEIVASKELSPACLATIRNFRGHKRLEVLVIREDLDGVAGSLEIVAPIAHAFNNS